MRPLLLFILLSFPTVSFSQEEYSEKEKIFIESIEIEENLGNLWQKFSFKIDTIKASVKVYKKKIEVTYNFKNSDTKLYSEHYFKDYKLLLIRFKEYSPTLRKYKKAYKRSNFYFKEGQLYYSEVGAVISGALAGMGVPQNTDEGYGYNKNLHAENLKELSEIVIDKVRKSAK